MNNIFFVLFICMLLFCCSVSPRIVGSWRTTYYNAEETKELDFFFNDFDLYNPPEYIPVIRIGTDSIDYPLAVIGGIKEKHGLGSNSVIYTIHDSRIEIGKGSSKETFRLEFEPDSLLCLYNRNVKVVCFDKMQTQVGCSSYNLELFIKNEYFMHKLFIDNEGRVLLVRKGVKNDSITTILTNYEMQYLQSLLSLVDRGEVKFKEQSNSGDHSEYKLLMECEGDTVIKKKYFGLRDVSFGIKALIKNLESYTQKEFKDN